MSVVKKPLITEKMTGITDKNGRVGFVVDRDATKEQIKADVERIYGVEVSSINTMVVSGKAKSKYIKTAGFVSGRTPSYKKAIVTLKEGHKIDHFENI